MDDTGVGVIPNMDGGFGTGFDTNMEVGGQYRDRIRTFRSSGAAALAHRRSSARPLAHLRHRAAARGAAEGYYANALRYLPSVRASLDRQLAARN